MSKAPRKKKQKTIEHPLGFRYLDDESPRSLHATPFSDILPQIIARYGCGRKIGVERFQNAWKDILDDLFGSLENRSVYDQHLKLIAFRGHTIRIEVNGNILLQEISFYKNTILKLFQQKLPEENIRSVKFVIQ